MMFDAAAKLPVFGRKMQTRVLLGCAALAATLVLAGPAPELILTAPAHAESLRHPMGFAEVVKRVKPAVLAVRVKMDAGLVSTNDGLPDRSPLKRAMRRFGSPRENSDNSSKSRGPDLVTGQGSGFFISADGYAVTNSHVVENARLVEVTTDDGATRTAKVIGIDSRSDLALIKVDGDHFPFVDFSDSSPEIGDWVLAVGNPFGFGGTVTAGIVSARGRDIGAGPYDDFIQIDAPVNRGNSGGPAFDMDGKVIGVNTAIVSPSGGSVGIGFAIPAETAKAVITQLREKGSVIRGWIGLEIEPVTPEVAESVGLKEARGALVAEPQADSPAARAGIEAGDVITAVNGKDISDGRDLARTIGGISPGAAVTLNVIRKGQEKTFNMAAGILQDQPETAAVLEAPRQVGNNVPELGITVTTQRGRNGVAVSKVDPDGPASGRGIKNGDVIVAAAGRRVATAGALRDAINAAQKTGRNSVLLQVKSGNAIKFVAMPVDRG
jgi:serine protease Do